MSLGGVPTHPLHFQLPPQAVPEPPLGRQNSTEHALKITDLSLGANLQPTPQVPILRGGKLRPRKDMTCQDLNPGPRLQFQAHTLP